LLRQKKEKCFFRTKEFKPKEVEKLFSEAIKTLNISNTQR